MRIRNKVLAFVLAMLMVIGMLPLSVFAAAGDTASDSSDPKPQTREEWVAAQGGKMLFGSSFDDTSKINGATLNSDDGNGTGNMSNASTTKGGAKSAVENGGLHLTSGTTTGDLYPVLNLDTTSGSSVTFEISLKFNKPMVAAGSTDSIFYLIDDATLDGSDRTRRLEGTLLTYRALENAEDGTPRAAISLRQINYKVTPNTFTYIDLVEFSMGEEVSVKITVDTASMRISGYDGDGNYKGTVSEYSSRYDYIDNPDYSSYQTADYPSLNTTRWVQISDQTNQDLYINDLYVYEGVSQPYGTEYSATGAGGLTGLRKYLRENDAKYFAYHDFEDVVTYGRPYTVDEATGLNVYNLNLQNYHFYTPGMSVGSSLNQWKTPSTHTIRGEIKDGDLNRFLRMETIGAGDDTYLDIYANKGTNAMTKYAEGDKVVIQVSLRKSNASDNFAINLFSLKNRSYFYQYEQIAGADTPDTSDDKYARKGTQSNGKWTYTTGNCDIGALSIDADGNIYRGSGANKQTYGKLKVNAFTDVAIVIDSKNNTFSVVIDGEVKASNIALLNATHVANYTEDYKYVKTSDKHTDGRDIYTKDESRVWNTGMYSPHECRVGAVRPSNAKQPGTNGYLDIDNWFIYAGANISAENIYVSNNIVGEPQSWEQNAEGYWRYYGADGKPVTGTQEIGGKKYYFTDDGYFATIEREYLISFDNVTSNGVSAAEDRLAASSDVTFGWKYSALWTNIFYEGAPGDESIKLDINGDNKTDGTGESISSPYTYGANQIIIPASSSTVNPKFKRNLTDAEKTAYSLTATSTYTVFNYGDYAGIEINWFVDKAVDMHMKSVSYGHNSTSAGANYGKYDNAITNTASGTNGWHSTILDITSGFAPMEGARLNAFGDFRVNMAIEFGLKASWDNCNGGKYLDDVKIYIGRIDLVKYVPAKLDVSPETLTEVRKVDGKTVIYADNMSTPSVGWVTVGTDKYFCTPDGVAQIGAYKIGESIYEFDDNGKLVGNADGLYTINGKNYYYENGVAKIGTYTVTIGEDQITINTKGDGEIENINGALPDIKIGSYSALDYDTLLAGKNVLTKWTFNDLPVEEPEYKTPSVNNGAIDYTKYSGNVPYIGHSSTNSENVNIGTGTGEIKWYIRRTKFRYVSDGTNDVALKTYNESLLTNTYGDINFDVSKPYKNIVTEASFKLGEDWNSTATLFMVFDRSPSGSSSDRNQQAGASVTIDQYGYVKFADAVVWKLSTTEYTRISLVHEDGAGSNGSLHLYVNGVKVYTHAITNANFDAPTKVRIASYGDSNVGHGSLYIDDIYAYEGTVPVAVDTTTEVKNGVVIEEGVKRYFQNGAVRIGIFTAKENGAHKIYGFNSVNGLPIDDFNSSYYFVNGEAALYQGVITLGGVDYYFGPDYKVVHDKNVVNHLDPSKSYTTDANGAIIKTDLFNDKTVNSADEIANNKNYLGSVTESGKLYYDTLLGANAFKTAKRDHHITLFRVEDGLDLSDYDFLNFKVYVNEALKNASFGIVIGSDLTYLKVTNYNSDTNRYESMVEGSGVYSLEWYDNSTQTGYKEVGTSKIYVKYNAGTPDYTDVYARRWDYTCPIYNFHGRTGWVDISISLKDFNQKYIDAAESIVLVTNGWNMNSGLSQSENLSVAQASLSTFEETYETLNGWIDGRFYVNGFVKTGWYNYNGTWYYLDPTTGHKTTGIAMVPKRPDEVSTGNYYYYEFNDAGVCQGKAEGFVGGTSWTYDAENKVYNQKAVKRIIKDGVLVTGIQTVNGNKYYVDPDTYAVVTNASLYVNGELINTDKDGVIAEVFNTWVVVGNNVYYYDASGKPVSGYTSIATDKDGNAGGYYYFDETTNVMIRSGWATVYGDVEMFFGADGKAANGMVVDTVLGDRGALDNTGYFVDGVPATTEATDGQYKYIFINGMLVDKILIEVDAPEILIWIIKDGVKHSFYFSVKADGSFEKKFSSYACYKLEIYDITTGTPVKLEITNNTLVIAAGSTSHTYEVRYTPVEHTYPETPNNTVEAGCATEGYNEYVCEFCGEISRETIKPVGNHEYSEWKTLIEPTCSHEGLKAKYCSCGAYVTEEIDCDPTKHSVIDDDKDPNYYYQPPTCTVGGYKSGVCEWCGEREIIQTLDPLKHDYENVTWTEDVKATCVSKGTLKGICGRDGCDEVLYKETPVDPDYHKHGINGTITKESEAGDYFILFKTVKASTCQNAGTGIFRCLDCGGFVGDEDDEDSLVVLNLDPDNHENEWGDEYLVIFNEKGEIIETVTGATRAEMIEKSKFLCGYSGAWRKDCTNPNCVLKDGTTRIYTTVELINGNGAHKIDLSKFVTTTDTKDPLYGMHYYVCTKCEKAIQATKHIMSEFKSNNDGTHTVRCAYGCIIEDEGGNNGVEYSEKVDCSYKMAQVKADGNVTGHAMVCEDCSHTKDGTYVQHTDDNIIDGHNATHHFSKCETCGYYVEYEHNFDKSVKDATKGYFAAQKATCWQIGWDEYWKCDACGYETPHTEYTQHAHSISGVYKHGTDGHWYACKNEYDLNGDGEIGDGEKCDYKHHYEAHDMDIIAASPALCGKAGTVAHAKCSVCGWCDPNSFDSEDLYNQYPDGIIPALEHTPGGNYEYDSKEHWQYCDRVVNGEVCGAIIRNGHTYNTNTNLLNYSDELGTAVHKCDTCDHKKPLENLATWYSVLGNPDKNIEVKKEGTDYYLYNNGVKKTNYLAQLSDGSYRYFDKDGKLVMNVESYGDKQFNSITAFGPAGLTNLIGAITYEGTTTLMYPGYNDPQAAKRGAIKNAIIETGEGIMMIENGVLQTGWQKITVTFDNDVETDNEDRWYYFNSKLGDVLVNANIREGALVKSTATSGDLTITALNINNTAPILVNVRADGSRLLGVVPNEGGSASLYIDGTAGKMSEGWVADNYYNVGAIYYIFADKTLANGNYVETVGGIYWNFTDYKRADEHCKNVYWDCGDQDAATNLWINVEGKKAENEIVTIDNVSYYIVVNNSVQSLFAGDYDEVSGVYYTFDDGVVTGLLTSWLPETVGETTVYKKYVLNGILQKSTFVDIVEDSVTNTYYFDADGNKIVSKIVYIKNVLNETAQAWKFDENGVAETHTNDWVYFIGEDGLVDTEHKGYYFDTSKGLAYGVQDGSIAAGAIYFFNQYGYLEVGIEKEYNGVVYWLDETTGKATIKTEEDE